MTICLDAQLPPSLAQWITENFQEIECPALREIGLRDATDHQIFEAARTQDVIVMTKDSDFAQLVSDKGTPPKIIWITCGNTSNAKMRDILNKTLQDALYYLHKDEPIVEIADQ